MVVDPMNRPLGALRISVTDRCNYRCTYCMPRDAFAADHPFLPKDQVLSFEEIERLARVFVGLGVRKIRLTGGEPLLRRDLPDLIRAISEIPGLEDLAMTTNGALLEGMAEPLRKAGLKRLTMSLDTLDPERFRKLCDTPVPLAQLLRGLKAAIAAGFPPPKLNCVLQRGVNEDEVEALAAHAREGGYPLRFIEFMDVGTTNGWDLKAVVPSAEVHARVHARWPLEPVGEPLSGRVAERWRYRDGRGEVGFISSVSAPFCGGCDRARLSAEGRLYTCLFAAEGLDLRGFLRAGHGDAEVAAVLSALWGRREDRYSELRTAQTPRMPRVEMSRMGG